MTPSATRKSPREIARDLGVTRRVQGFGVSWTDDLLAIGPAPAVVFDIGANLGQTAEECVRAFPDATIHSFEPVPGTFGQLRENVSRLPGVIPVNLALSNRGGEAEITVDYSDGYGGKNSLAPDPSHAGAPTATVTLSTVDDYVRANGVDRVDLLKIDVEGHELAVLEGAADTLASSVQFLLAEIDFEPSPDSGHSYFMDLYEVLMPLGFKVAAFYCEGIREWGWHWGDVLFVREGVIDGRYIWSRQKYAPPLRYQKPLIKTRTYRG